LGCAVKDLSVKIPEKQEEPKNFTNEEHLPVESIAEFEAVIDNVLKETPV